MTPDLQPLYDRVGTAMLEDAPAGDWTALRSTYVAAGKVSEHVTFAEMADGRRSRLRPGVDFVDALDELRRAMHDTERGVWYTAEITVSRDLRLSIDFNYDDEPQWGLAISPRSYVEDLELFPRAEAAQPEWLRRRVAEASS